MRREVQYALERRRDQLLLKHMIWWTLPWYVKLWRTVTFRAPEAL